VAIPPFSGTETGLSAGTLKLGRQQEALLAQRPVTGVAFCPGPSPLLLASYAPVGAQLGAAALLQVRVCVYACACMAGVAVWEGE
jgi:hypothetical protein